MGFYRPKLQVTTGPNMGKNSASEPQFHPNVPSSNFCPCKRLTGHGPRSPDDQIWAKMQFWSNNSSVMYQVATLSIEMTYWVSVEHFWGLKVKVIKWLYMGKIQRSQRNDVRSFVQNFIFLRIKLNPSLSHTSLRKIQQKFFVWNILSLKV